MSDIGDLISQLKKLESGRINFEPYNFRDDIKVHLGTAPPVPIIGIDSINVAYLHPRAKLISCLTGGATFVSNRNLNGFVEFVMMDGSPSCAAIQALEILGIPYPIAGVDINTGGTSRFLATACRRVNTPQWRKSRRPSRLVFMFHTTRLLISNGVRLPHAI